VARSKRVRSAQTKGWIVDCFACGEVVNHVHIATVHAPDGGMYVSPGYCDECYVEEAVRALHDAWELPEVDVTRALLADLEPQEGCTLSARHLRVLEGDGGPEAS